MKKTNDASIYIIFTITVIAVSAFFASVSLYSRFNVEPEVKKLLSEKDNSAGSYEKAYLMLREPQLFAGYSYWDADGTPVRNTIRYFDSRISRGMKIRADEKVYLGLLLNRRESGALLGLKSAIFFLLLGGAGFTALMLERREQRKS